MIFLFRAAFWTLVVSAFVPAGFYAPDDGAFARQAEEIAANTLHESASPSVDAAAHASAVCEGRQELCDTAGELARFAGWTASLAADRAEQAFQSLSENREAAQPAPRTAEEVFAAAASDAPAR